MRLGEWDNGSYLWHGPYNDALAGSAMLGAAGDVFLLVAVALYTCAFKLELPPPFWAIVWFSVADGIKCTAFSLLPMHDWSNGPFGQCAQLAFVTWWGFFSSTLWQTMYSLALWHHH